MHTVELLDEALRVAQRLGYRVRQEWLGGAGGGACEIRGHKWLFLDLALAPDDQLELVLAALRGEPALTPSALPPSLQQLLNLRQSA